MMFSRSLLSVGSFLFTPIDFDSSARILNRHSSLTTILTSFSVKLVLSVNLNFRVESCLLATVEKDFLPSVYWSSWSDSLTSSEETCCVTGKVKWGERLFPKQPSTVSLDLCS